MLCPFAVRPFSSEPPAAAEAVIFGPSPAPAVGVANAADRIAGIPYSAIRGDCCGSGCSGAGWGRTAPRTALFHCPTASMSAVR